MYNHDLIPEKPKRGWYTKNPLSIGMELVLIKDCVWIPVISPSGIPWQNEREEFTHRLGCGRTVRQRGTAENRRAAHRPDGKGDGQREAYYKWNLLTPFLPIQQSSCPFPRTFTILSLSGYCLPLILYFMTL